ncbi:MAG: metal-sulfur cluster assembly factor [Verrucomicrobiota bacterium]|nr:MAG: metal-sulfur cluster assembly factor [Verrucomicrobiota bacterium]
MSSVPQSSIGTTFDREMLWEQLKTIEDPDVHVNIVDLGLIYQVDGDIENKTITVVMTLTSPSCPMGDFLLRSVEDLVLTLYPEYEAQVQLVWDPPWNMDMISEIGKLELGIFV